MQHMRMSDTTQSHGAGTGSGALTNCISIEIAWREVSRNCHTAAVGHVEPEPPAVRGVRARVGHLPRVFVEHYAANARKNVVRGRRSEFVGVLGKMLSPAAAHQDAGRELVRQLPERRSRGAAAHVELRWIRAPPGGSAPSAT